MTILNAIEIDKNIRIYNACEGRIEKSVQRITVWHHEACFIVPTKILSSLIFIDGRSYICHGIDSL